MSRPALTVAWMPSRLVYFPDEIRTTSLMPRAPCGSGLARESGLGLAAKAAPTAKRFYSRPQQGTQHGFTRVELVMVIAIAGLVAVLISTVMSNPLQSFVDQSRRAELVDAGWLRDSGEKRPTAAGNPSIDWEATPVGV